MLRHDAASIVQGLACSWMLLSILVRNTEMGTKVDPALVPMYRRWMKQLDTFVCAQLAYTDVTSLQPHVHMGGETFSGSSCTKVEARHVSKESILHPATTPLGKLWPQLNGRSAGFGGRRLNCVDRIQEKDPSPARHSCPTIYSLSRRIVAAERACQVRSDRSALPSEVLPNLWGFGAYSSVSGAIATHCAPNQGTTFL